MPVFNTKAPLMNNKHKYVYQKYKYLTLLFDIMKWDEIISNMYNVKAHFFMDINFCGLVKNYKFVDFVFASKMKFMIYIFST